jgi:vacuolar-type H+-ATPase subunit E/Vma4
MLKDIESKYHEFMLDKTKRDEYNVELTIIENNYLSEETDQGCGGIILYTVDNRIVCPNTLINRLDLAFEELLPSIRSTLFPELHK